MSEYLSRFSALLTAASESEIRSDPTLGGRLTLDRSGAIEVSYAPFDYVQRTARVVIVGITPGAHQAANALTEARRNLLRGGDLATALRSAKVFASFSGPMRANLIAMLDQIGVARCLGIPSASLLWGERQDLIHFTSALRYPVFVGGENYNGQPPMSTTPLLQRYLETCLREEASALPDAVWVPLGPKAAGGLRYLVRRGAVSEHKVLEGLPHPSGANGERIAYFLGRKSRDALSSKTNPTALDEARECLVSKVSRLTS